MSLSAFKPLGLLLCLGLASPALVPDPAHASRLTGGITRRAGAADEGPGGGTVRRALGRVNRLARTRVGRAFSATGLGEASHPGAISTGVAIATGLGVIVGVVIADLLSAGSTTGRAAIPMLIAGTEGVRQVIADNSPGYFLGGAIAGLLGLGTKALLEWGRRYDRNQAEYIRQWRERR
jgi:hypothetical protein